MSDKAWEERRPGYYAYYDVIDHSVIYGDVRTIIVDPNEPCKYVGSVHTPPPRGKVLGTFDTLEEAKQAVEDECARQMI